MKPISYAYIETTSYCNLDCSFCNRREVVSNPVNMSVEDYKIVLKKLAGQDIKEVKLMGLGEPFMHPQFHEICRLTREAFPRAFIISSTNCQFSLNGNVKKSLQYLDLLYLSIDGASKNYEKYRKPAKWSKLLKFLLALSETDWYGCRIAINYTVNPENVYDIPKVEKMLDRYGFHELRLNIVQNWSEDQSAESVISGFTQVQLDFLHNSYQHLIKGKAAWSFSDCFWVKEGIYITATGDMKVCCMNTSTKSIGNVIRDLSVQELRRSKRYVEIANGCLSNMPTDHCKNCSYKELTPVLSKLL